MGKKQLDAADRMTLQGCLEMRQSIRQIAFRLGVTKTTVYRELERNARHITGGQKICHDRDRLVVCNTCRMKAYCQKDRLYYDYVYAIDVSDRRRKLSRSSPKLAPNLISIVDAQVSAGVLLGQSLHHIYASSKPLKGICSEATVRRLCYRGNLSVKPFQLRKYVVYRREYANHERPRTRNIQALVGRTYKDYKRAVASHKKANVVQYDSLIGMKEDRQVILTIAFPKFGFQFGRLVDKCSPLSVVRAVEAIRDSIGNEVFMQIFPINLCDNGVEFAFFFRIEADERGERLCSTFFTNPYRATDKAECERLHEFVRYFIPKGKSLDGFTQDTIDDMFSHINSYVRKSLGDRCPYDLVRRKFGKTFLDQIGIKRIPKKKVRLLQII